MTRTIIDIHILQTVPPSNINRDDTGSPKTAYYGGTKRARVSSQAWKRATRKAFEGLVDEQDLGVRTTHVVEILARRIASREPGLDDRSLELAETTLKTVGIKVAPPKRDQSKAPVSGYLLFLSNQQLDNLAEKAVEAAATGDAEEHLKSEKKALKAILAKGDAVDLALFGRMVADDSDLNVDAACQVAHAISVHPVTNEYDYFTAVDDAKDSTRTDDEAADAGAGMIGTVEFNSSTLYRYATIDVDRLEDNLGDAEATGRAVAAFITAFVSAMPTGKQNTFANRTLPDAVVVQLRDDQSVNLVGAFEAAVPVNGTSGIVGAAADRLADFAKDLDQAYGDAPVRTWVLHVGERTSALGALGDAVSRPELAEAVKSAVLDRIGEQK